MARGSIGVTKCNDAHVAGVHRNVLLQQEAYVLVYVRKKQLLLPKPLRYPHLAFLKPIPPRLLPSSEADDEIKDMRRRKERGNKKQVVTSAHTKRSKSSKPMRTERMGLKRQTSMMTEHMLVETSLRRCSSFTV